MAIEMVFGGFRNVVTEQISCARNSLYIAVGWIDLKIYHALFKSLHNGGVSIRLIVSDTPQIRKQQYLINGLISHGIEVTILKMPGQYNHMHHKFCIIDETTVLTGSYNWSGTADLNFENLMIIRDDQNIVRQFKAEFDKVIGLNTSAIHSLQNLTSCSKSTCRGFKVSVIVFSDRADQKTNELIGDRISFCSECIQDDVTDFEVVESAIQETQLQFLFDATEFITDEFSQVSEYTVRRDIDKYLTVIGLYGNDLHGIGKVCHEFYTKHDDHFITRMMWKNKFVEQYIQDRYETDFNINY